MSKKNVRPAKSAVTDLVALSAQLPTELATQHYQQQLVQQRLRTQIDAALIITRRSLGAAISKARDVHTALDAQHKGILEALRAATDDLILTARNTALSSIDRTVKLPFNLHHIVSDTTRTTYYTGGLDGDGDRIKGDTSNFRTIEVEIANCVSLDEDADCETPYWSSMSTDKIKLPALQATIAVTPAIKDLQRELADLQTKLDAASAEISRLLTEQGKLPQYEQEIVDTLTIRAAMEDDPEGQSLVSSFAADICTRLGVTADIPTPTSTTPTADTTPNS